MLKPGAIQIALLSSATLKNLPLICYFVLSGAFAQNKVEVNFGELSEVLQQEYAGDFEFSVLIGFDNELVYTENFGYIDKNKSIPVHEKTLFNIASVTKSITAVGILKLMEQNRITLEDTLGAFFENVPNSMKSITVRTLLAHRSGLAQTYPLNGINKSDEAIQIIWKSVLEFTPDSGFRYSNQNYQVLALIIEKVTQMPFEEYVTEAILVPLGMKNTCFWDTANGQEIAPARNRILNSLGKRNWSWIGAAGMFSTTGDLYKFWTGVHKNGFLTQKSIDLLFGNYFTTQSGVEIGFGFFTSPKTQWNTPELWTRGTESWGHNAAISHFPEKGFTIVVVSNSGEIGNDRNKTGNRLIRDRVADFLFE